MPILKRANRVLAGPVALYLPKGLASTLGRGARGADSFGQPRLGSEEQHLFCPSPTGPGKAPGFQL